MLQPSLGTTTTSTQCIHIECYNGNKNGDQ
jgi:hypothetical protein